MNLAGLKGEALEAAIALEDLEAIAAWLEGKRAISFSQEFAVCDLHLTVSTVNESRRWRFPSREGETFARATALARASLVETITKGVQ